MVQLDATRPIDINVVQKSSDGTITPYSKGDTKITLEPLRGVFGTINDDQDVFNPGNSGDTGIIRAEAGGKIAEVAVELVSGTLGHLDLVLVDRADHPSIVKDIQTLPTTPGQDNRPADPPHLSEYQASNRERAKTQGLYDLPSNYAATAPIDVTTLMTPDGLKAKGEGEVVIDREANPSAALTNSHASTLKGSKTRVVAGVDPNTTEVATEVPGAKDDSGDTFTFENTHAPDNGGTPVAVVTPGGGPTVGAAQTLGGKPTEGLKEPVSPGTVVVNDEDDDEDEPKPKAPKAPKK